jgi:long-chain fatty acid transport protein
MATKYFLYCFFQTFVLFNQRKSRSARGMLFTYNKISVKTVIGNIMLLLLLGMPGEVSGAAFLIYNQDARANGMGMAVVSSVNNPSAVFYNPARLPYQKGFGGSVGDTMIMPTTYFKDHQRGQKSYARSTTHHLPSVFVKYTEKDLSFGVGIFSPFGLSTQWPNNWTGRYTTTFAEIKTTFVNPVLAYRVNGYLSLGFGVSHVQSSVTMKNAIDLGFIGLPDGNARLKGDGEGIGYNAGCIFTLPAEFTISFTYRSAIPIRYDGKVSLYMPPPLASSAARASTKITLPYLAVFGVAKDIGPLTLEGDILYTGWSSLRGYRITSDDKTADAYYGKNWRNVPSIALGFNYQWTRSFEIRGGYMHDKSPVPAQTLGPELPDATRNIFTVGTTIGNDHFKVDLGYQATFFEKADSTRSIVSPRGTYGNFAHLIFVSFTYNR